MSKPLVTGLFNGLSKLDELLENLLGSHQTHEEKLQLSTWSPDLRVCPIHRKTMYQSLVSVGSYRVGDWVCEACHEVALNRKRAEIEHGTIRALFPDPSGLREAMPGVFERSVRNSMKRAVVSAYEKPLQIAPPLHVNHLVEPLPALLSPDQYAMTFVPTNRLSDALQPTTTGILPARDIELASTPQATRTTLFDDVPDVSESLLLWPKDILDETDENATERRPIVRKTDTRHARNTIIIVEPGVEELLFALMSGPEHEQATGENERLPERE